MVNVLTSRRDYENEESYFSADNVCISTAAAAIAMNKEIDVAIAAELEIYNVANEDELREVCKSFNKTVCEKGALVRVGAHTYEWRIDTLDVTGIPSYNGKELGKILINSVNTFGFDEKGFAAEISGSHRTLQQSAMRIMMAAIKELANCYPDARNESTVALAKAICALPEAQYGLSMI